MFVFDFQQSKEAFSIRDSCTVEITEIFLSARQGFPLDTNSVNVAESV